MEHQVKILGAHYITHDVKQFTVERPAGYIFNPGQATDISLTEEGWRDQLRPFTFTCLPDAPQLEFTIKIYRERDGVTKRLGSLNAGASIILHDVFGAIHYQGPGVFIAGGAGITPFIAILRHLHAKHKLGENKLIFSNKTEDDIILRDEFETMLKDCFIPILTRGNTIGFRDKRIDRDFLVETISDFSQFFYVCGPDDFVTEINKQLLELGANAQSLVFEK